MSGQQRKRLKWVNNGNYFNFFIVERGQPETALRGMSTDYMLT